MKNRILSLYIMLIFSFPCLLLSDPPIGEPLYTAIPSERKLGKTSQSFMFTRPVFRNIAAQTSSFWHDAVYDKPGCFGSSFQIIPLYQHSITSSKIGRYFLLNHKDTIVIKGDATPPNPTNPNTRDVRAEWLNLPNDFIGTLSVSPKQRQYGIWMEFNQDIKKFICYDFLESIWIGFAIPFQYVENTMQPRQRLISGTSATFPHDIIEAFNQSTQRYGKISDKKLKRQSIAQVQLKLGTTFMNRDGFQLGMSSCAIFPTYGHQNPEFMFDPFLGHNRHFGFGAMVNMQLPLNDDVECKLISFFFNIENLYFFGNDQRRTLDIRFKQWSRYVLLNKNDGQKNIPGVNVLTRKVRVKPYNMVDLDAGIRAQIGAIEGEIGYNLWAHGDEKVHLKKPFQPKYGIAGDGTVVPGTNIGATASKSTIAQQSDNDTENGKEIFVPIKEYDLDLRSGAARAAVVHRAHVAIGFVHDEDTMAWFFGIGGFGEVPHYNTALKNWGIWAKAGGTF
jgi:hypothetical protein